MSEYWTLPKSGKTLFMLQKSAQTRSVIIVASERRRQELLQTAKRLGFGGQINVAVIGKANKGITFAGAIVDDQYEKPWIDARPGRGKQEDRRFEVQRLPSKGVIERAMRELIDRPPQTRYIYRSRAKGKTLLTIIDYFMGSGVVVEDGEGKLWLNGKPYKENI